MATKYEKLEAEYNQLSTPEQQWAWVLAHKDDVKISFATGATGMALVWFPKDDECMMFISHCERSDAWVALLSVLGIEVEEV